MRARASTTTHPSGPAMTGFKSSSATSGRSSARRATLSTTSASAENVSRRRAAKAAHEKACLSTLHELVRVCVGQRRQAEAGVADQLGHRAAWTEGDQRPEHRILEGAHQHLDPAVQKRLDEHRQTDPCCRLSDRVAITEVECNSSLFCLVHAGGGGLHDDWIAEVIRSGERFLEGGCHALRHDW